MSTFVAVPESTDRVTEHASPIRPEVVVDDPLEDVNVISPYGDMWSLRIRASIKLRVFGRCHRCLSHLVNSHGDRWGPRTSTPRGRWEYNLQWANLSDGLEQLGRMDRRRNGQGKTRFFTQIREPLGIPSTEGELQVLIMYVSSSGNRSCESVLTLS